MLAANRAASLLAGRYCANSRSDHRIAASEPATTRRVAIRPAKSNEGTTTGLETGLVALLCTLEGTARHAGPEGKSSQGASHDWLRRKQSDTASRGKPSAAAIASRSSPPVVRIR